MPQPLSAHQGRSRFSSRFVCFAIVAGWSCRAAASSKNFSTAPRLTGCRRGRRRPCRSPSRPRSAPTRLPRRSGRAPCGRSRRRASPRRRSGSCSGDIAPTGAGSARDGGEKFEARSRRFYPRKPPYSPQLWHLKTAKLLYLQQLKSGGGGGSRTRVRKACHRRNLHAYPSLLVRGRRKSTAKAPAASPDESHRSNAGRERTASLLNGVRPQPAG